MSKLITIYQKRKVPSPWKIKVELEKRYNSVYAVSTDLFADWINSTEMRLIHLDEFNITNIENWLSVVSMKFAKYNHPLTVDDKEQIISEIYKSKLTLM